MRRHDNWDRSRGSHGGVDCWDKMGDDHIDAKSDQFFSELLGAIAPPFGIAELDRDVLAFRIAKRAQSLSKSIGKRMWGRSGDEHSNTRQFSRLLRARGERPGDRSAEKGDEIPSTDAARRDLELSAARAWDVKSRQASVPIPKFASLCRGLVCETSESKDTSNLLIQCGFGSEVRISDSARKNDADF
jgi:hypothetical protein